MELSTNYHFLHEVCDGQKFAIVLNSQIVQHDFKQIFSLHSYSNNPQLLLYVRYDLISIKLFWTSGCLVRNGEVCYWYLPIFMVLIYHWQLSLSKLQISQSLLVLSHIECFKQRKKRISIYIYNGTREGIYIYIIGSI